MENNAALTATLIICAFGTLYFLAIGAKAVMRLVGLVIRVLIVTLLIGMGYIYLSRTVQKYETEDKNGVVKYEDRDHMQQDERIIETVNRDRQPARNEKVRKL